MYNFTITKHAFERYKERFDSEACIYNDLRKAHLCNNVESLEIETNYVLHTMSPKKTRPNDVYFRYNDIIFACTRTGIKEFTVQTCWEMRKPQTVSTEVLSESELVTLNLKGYILGDKEFSLDEVIKIMHGKQFSREIKQYIKYLKKTHPNLDKKSFMKMTKHLTAFENIYHELQYQ